LVRVYTKALGARNILQRFCKTFGSLIEARKKLVSSMVKLFLE
jgi:hypothetical protein